MVLISTQANAECGTVGELMPVSDVAAPRGHHIPAQGQSEAAPAAERRPGFRSPPAAGEPNGDHHNGTPPSLNPSAPRHARSVAASFTCRLHGLRLARPPVLARLGTRGGARSAPG